MDPDKFVSPTKDQVTREPPLAAVITPTGATAVPRDDTPPPIRDAITAIESFVFSPDESPDTKKTQSSNEDLQALMMFSPRAAIELPTLCTETWTYCNQKPNPISINKAKKLLAAGYSNIPCELDGTGIHGYAWMIEPQEVWSKRSGVTATILVPSKPTKPTTYDIKEQLAYTDQMEAYRLYTHLVQEGRRKVLGWFGKAMFVDLYEDDMLPPTITPTELIEHLARTYSQGRDNRRHMEAVETEFNATYDPKKPVEQYFMKIQDAKANAALLGQPFTEQQTMNRALKQFEAYLGKDAYKAEKRWNAHAGNTWIEFKTFWKDEIHQWESVNKNTRQAHQAVTEQVDSLTGMVNDLQIDLTALQAENRSVQDQNTALLAIGCTCTAAGFVDVIIVRIQ